MVCVDVKHHVYSVYGLTLTDGGSLYAPSLSSLSSSGLSLWMLGLLDAFLDSCVVVVVVPPPFSPSLISLMVSVDVKHHVYNYFLLKTFLFTSADSELL